MTILCQKDNSVASSSNPLDEIGRRGRGVRDPINSSRLEDKSNDVRDITGDRVIDRRIHATLLLLLRLSEQKAKEEGSSKGKADSRPPVNVGTLDRPVDAKRPPRKDESLYEYYLWHVQQMQRLCQPTVEEKIHFRTDTKAEAAKKQALRRARVRSQMDLAVVYLFLAERDLRRFYKGAVDQATDERRKSEKEIDWDILAYEGVSALEVALVTGYKVSQVEKLRRFAKRDKDTGYAQEERGTPGQRREEARTLKRRHPHLSLQQIADRVGVGKSTVARYLDDDRDKAA